SRRRSQSALGRKRRAAIRPSPRCGIVRSAQAVERAASGRAKQAGSQGNPAWCFHVSSNSTCFQAMGGLVFGKNDRIGNPDRAFLVGKGAAGAENAAGGRR